MTTMTTYDPSTLPWGVYRTEGGTIRIMARCAYAEDAAALVAALGAGLLDLSIDGGRGDQDCPGDELSAIVADFAGKRLDRNHPCWFVAVGQFQPAAGGAS